ncbi:osmotically-inducible lipoprotein OsmE [Pseudomonas sp. Teo4]|uniref:osmotically-inducible lipoprotein OsmE n=1 Tax=Pseudomonas sp. Teo4 TaxID=3064528 RepID=UPI002AB80609|nr:osmotically-inducible lipoprotein OsmE [Pseudomonas sp. Teo4]MDZ3992230.1 Osmotically-inducible putative lipoprotein OsmE [Pseudomonas sp. Teo4]
MKTLTLALAMVLAAAVGCSSNSSLYQDQPLVSKVAEGMNKTQVVQIGGQPQSVSERTVVPGTCFDYTLVKSGQQQAYSVSFDEAGKVDKKSFMTCAQWSHAQQKSREPLNNMGGMGGAGY